MKKRRVMKRIFSLLMTMCLVFAMTVIVSARDGNGNSYVTEDRTGTLLIKVGVTDKDDSSKIHYVKSGTGFLVNDTTLITCSHVVNFDEEDLKGIQENWEMSEKQANEHKFIRVFLYRDDFYAATITAESDNADIAVLGLKESIKNRTYLKIRTSEVVSTEPCYTLGFPFLVGAVDDQELNTKEDVTINGGIVNKITEVNSISYIVHDAKTLEGNSGGPVVDQMGNVIGVSQAYTSQSGFSADYNYALGIEEVTNLLDPRGISYTVVEESAEEIEEIVNPDNKPGPDDGNTGEGSKVIPVNKTALENAIKTANDLDTSGWSNEQIKKRDDAVKAANEVMNNDSATQEEVNAAADKLSGTLDEIEKDVLSEESSGSIRELTDIRSELRDLRIHYAQLMDLSQELEENENEFFKENNERYFHLVFQRVQTLHEMTSSLADYTSHIRDLNQTQIDIKQNKIMTILTVVTSIFMPLTLITGWYGMNFVHMPELKEPAAYPIVIAVCILIVIGCLVFFKRKKWL